MPAALKTAEHILLFLVAAFLLLLGLFSLMLALAFEDPAAIVISIVPMIAAAIIAANLVWIARSRPHSP